MMAEELICQIHGPYDASYGACPYDHSEAGGRPGPPIPLDEDDLPTDLGAPGAPSAGYDDEAPTDLGGSYGNRRILDEEITDLRRDDFETEFDEPDTGPIAILWIKDGPRRGKIRKVKDGSVIGRTQGDISLDDPKVSNPHARLRYENEKFVIWDFGSRNGTFVNNEQIRSATELEENDEVKIGETTFVFKQLPE